MFLTEELVLWPWRSFCGHRLKHTHTPTARTHPPARAGCPCRCRYRQSRGGQDFTGGYSKMSPFLFQQLWLFAPTRKRRGCCSRTRAHTRKTCGQVKHARLTIKPEKDPVIIKTAFHFRYQYSQSK